jgi:DNA-binding MarR family transcriptional regulator
MNRAEKSINHVLVRLFNDILGIEERALTGGEFSDASVREMHVLEATAAAGEENSMSAIAARLGITVGSLTVAVTTLERKGYLRRERAFEDKRVVRVFLTNRGKAANDHHARFHQQMVEAVQGSLPQEELDILSKALDHVTAFFEQYLHTR